MRADLHVHSSASDGTEPPAEVMRRAAQAGLDVVALTDHDTVAGHAEARRALADSPLAGSLTLLPGMELSCRLGEHSRGVPGGLLGSSPRGQHSVHLLAYLFDAGYPDLAAELGRIRDDRVLRARAMVSRLADLGVDITWDQVAAIAGPAVVGRPHIARAMAASGAVASPREAFTRDWIGDGGRAYVGRYALDPVHAIGLVRDAGGVAVLAHPRAGQRQRRWVGCPTRRSAGWPPQVWPGWRFSILTSQLPNGPGSSPWPTISAWWPRAAATTTAA